MKAIITSPDLTPDANPRAASTRLNFKSLSQARGQRRHDLRLGKQPKYVDRARTHLNRVLVSPRPITQIRDEVVALRKQAGAIRTMKSTAAVTTAGVITFGHEAAEMFSALPAEAQDAAIRELAQAIADRLGTRLEALVVHLDETTIHAHYELRGYSNEGKPVSKILTPTVSSELQDVTATIMQRYCPGIERGNKKLDRIAAGANYSDTLHRSVKRLHRDLPLEIAAQEKRLNELQEKADTLTAALVKDHARVAKLEERERLIQKESMRLEMYSKRLRKRIEDHLASETALKEAQKVFEGSRRKITALASKAQEILAAVREQEADLHHRETELASEHKKLARERQAVADDLRAIDAVVGLMADGNIAAPPASISTPIAPVLTRASSMTRTRLGRILETFWQAQDGLTKKEVFLDGLIKKVRQWLQRHDLTQDCRAEGQSLGREWDNGPGW